MLEIYEGRELDRKLIRRMQGESIEIKAVNGYLIWLDLLAEGKVILQLFVSPHQLGRLGKYLSSGQWQGGIICPHQSQPENCDIRELNDQTKLGLGFYWMTKPQIEIEWLPDDRQLEAKKFLEATKLAYDMREPEPEIVTDLTQWKRKLFEL